MRVMSDGRGPDADDIAARLHMNPEFAQKVYDTVSPGATVVVTDQPVARKPRSAAVLEN
jgi:hypothetical protein